MHVALLGLGLIGGSIARAAIDANFAGRVTAWTPSGNGPQAARDHGIEAMGSPGEAIAGAELVVLAAPPLACLSLLDDLAGKLASALGPDTVITDVASTKREIVQRAQAHGLRFIGGHPMAGRETAGYEAADPDLVRGRPWVVVPSQPPDSAAEDRVVALALACGAIPMRMSASDHDAAVASVSHLPLLISAALVEAMTSEPEWGTTRQLAAGGWASMTRLARGDADMGAGILATNGPAVVRRLRAFQAVIDDWLTALDTSEPDFAALRERLATARERVTAAGGLDVQP